MTVIGTGRVTEQSSSARTLAGLRAGQNRLDALRERVTTGKRMSRPSDSATGTAAAMRVRAELAVEQRRARSAADGTARLGTAENALTSVSTLLTRARGLVVQAGSAPSSGSADARAALAAQVDSLRAAVLSAANTAHLGRPVFGGTTAGPAAFDAAGDYLGDDGAVSRRVDNGTEVRVDVSASVLGTGSSSVFGVLSSLSTALRAGQDVSGYLDSVDSRLSAVNSELASVGSRYSRLTDAADAVAARTTTLTGQLSDIEDVDLTEAVVDLQTQTVAYQAALAATARVQQPSLLDFLR